MHEVRSSRPLSAAVTGTVRSSFLIGPGK
jgi:hypothetical protein